jgi:putative transposase
VASYTTKCGQISGDAIAVRLVTDLPQPPGMARPLRVHIPGALYHVISRGNERKQIFADDEDYAHFLCRLSAVAARFAVRCLAYCLMPNHFHLLLRPNLEPLSEMMQQLNSSYSQRFNRKHERVGHLLQGRFKALLIDRDDYFRRVLRYIVLNPVRASLVQHPGEWPWSSYRATAGLGVVPRFLAMDEVWQAFGASVTAAPRVYAAFVLARPDEAADRPEGPVAWGSAQFVADVSAAIESQRACREIVYAERFAGRASLACLFSDACDSRGLDRRMWRAYEQAYTLREIGEFVGRPPATVWRRIRRAAGSVNCHGNEKIEI